jgi:hypothetical protein
MSRLAMLLLALVETTLALPITSDNVLTPDKKGLKNVDRVAAAEATCAAWCDQRWHTEHEFCQGCGWNSPPAPPVFQDVHPVPELDYGCCRSYPAPLPICASARNLESLCKSSGAYAQCNWVCASTPVPMYPTPTYPTPVPTYPTPVPTYPTCADDPTYVEVIGVAHPTPYTCAEWVNYDCTTAASHQHYTVAQQNRLIGSCPKSCGLCPAKATKSTKSDTK